MRDLQVRPIVVEEEGWWDTTMSRYHYLGFRRLVGESLKYIAVLDNEPVGLLGWGSAAFKNSYRDRWIGWSPEQQWQRLKYIVNNKRFLLLRRMPNLASRVLAANVRRLSQDWEALYGHPIVVVETFVDQTRFSGTCYKAAGWIPLGQTRGFRRNGGRYYFHGHPKTIFIRPVLSDARDILAAPFLSPKLHHKEGFMDLNSLVLEGEKGLFERLAKITDPRHRRGIRHQNNSIVAIGICACVSGCRSFAAIGQWASHLTQELRERFHCRKDPRTGRYDAPSEPTIRRVLQRTNAEELDQMIGEWLEGECKSCVIAVDGKTLRGSKTKDKKAVHLLSALVHKEGVVIAQKEVDGKTNEIKVLEPLLEDINLHGKIVTADAMQAQVSNAAYIKEQGGDYVFVVKGNQSSIVEAIKDLDSSFFPSEEVEYDKGHGRIETRKIRCSNALNDYLAFPYCGQVFKIERITTDLNGEKPRRETAYGITSLSPSQATPLKVLGVVRGHWRIENSLHFSQRCHL